jgi:hypothetical protein
MGVRGKGCEPLGDKGLGRVEEKGRVENKFSRGTPWLKIQDVSSLGRSRAGKWHTILNAKYRKATPLVFLCIKEHNNSGSG